MDFFQRQQTARRNTLWLVVLFLLAVVAMVGAVFGIAYFACLEWNVGQAAYRFDAEPGPFPWELPIGAALATLVVLVGGTFYKVGVLRSGGGTSVAESLGGKRLYPNTQGFHERRLLNVVEEMAIASGTPVPPVYLLDEKGINAFAAGFSSGDAVVGVTRGAMEELPRDELQGVIAHEFSHILNGDMRMNIRLIGILHGILLLGLIGQLVLRMFFYSGSYSSRRRDSSGDGKGGGLVLVILGVALALIVIGSIGTFIGGLIKAAVSRQREYLADASAVQFTRNPGGIAGALKRIGGWVAGSKVKHPRASEASHMFFGTAVWEGFTGLLATHPPLPKRIKAIEPNWGGVFEEVASGAGAIPETASGFASSPAAQNRDAAHPAWGHAGAQFNDSPIPLAVVEHASEHVGDPTEAHRLYARELLDSIDDQVTSAAHEPYGARALVYALLLDEDLEIRKTQFAELDKLAHPAVAELTRRLVPSIVRSGDRARLPIVDMALPSLRALSPGQYKQFSDVLRALVAADRRLSLFEWTLARVLMRRLQPQFEPIPSPVTRYYGLKKLSAEVSLLLSTMAHAGVGGANPHAAKEAFARAAKLLPEVELKLVERGECKLNAMDESLNKLSRATAKLRGQVIDACAEVICHDGYVNIKEAELLRGVSDLLDCPMPPLFAGQTVE